MAIDEINTKMLDLSKSHFVVYKSCFKNHYKKKVEDKNVDKFENVTAVKKANIYFEGKVTSRTILFEDGTRKTLGIMMPGQYEFSTADKENMEVLAGAFHVLLPDSDTWITYEEGHSFDVPANSVFKISTDQVSDYCCSYINE